MSTSSYIEIEFNEDFDSVILIKSFINNGWSLNDDGKISYLPEICDNLYDWERVDLDQEKSVFEEIRNKQIKNHPIGLALINKNLKSGGMFHFINSDKISISICVNRIKRDNDLTNFTLYLDNILLTIRDKSILSIKTEDSW